MQLDVIHNQDCFEGMKSLPDECIDLVATDPPYGMGITEWDKQVDIAVFTKQVFRLLKPGGFYAFFGQMHCQRPNLIDWINEAESLFSFKEHISWFKRNGVPSHRLSRGHEEILIYSNGSSDFYKTCGRYEDVKLPMLSLGLMDAGTIKRYIASLHREIRTGVPDMRGISGARHGVFDRLRSDHRRSPRLANYTNVWAFAPENRRAYNQGGKRHPTRKPILVIERLIEMLSPVDAIVLDAFMGSGTTAVCCLKLNRHYIGYEISADYCRLAEQRITDARAGLVIANQQAEFEWAAK